MPPWIVLFYSSSNFLDPGIRIFQNLERFLQFWGDWILSPELHHLMIGCVDDSRAVEKWQIVRQSSVWWIFNPKRQFWDDLDFLKLNFRSREQCACENIRAILNSTDHLIYADHVYPTLMILPDCSKYFTQSVFREIYFNKFPMTWLWDY